jgi:putative dimethyl sulfoxide reductase chaperone
MDMHTIISRETARHDIYKTLADCWRMPDQNMGTLLDTLAFQLTALDSKAGPCIKQMQIELGQIDDDLLPGVEFTRLFIGPYSLPCPPYGSVYMEKNRAVMGDSTVDARKRYQDLGVDLAKNFKEVPDHISVELEFMFLQVYKEIECFRSDEPGLVQQMLLHQQSFLLDHLHRWIPEFAHGVDKHAGIAFYRLLAEATRIFIEEECRYLEKILVPVAQ